MLRKDSSLEPSASKSSVERRSLPPEMPVVLANLELRLSGQSARDQDDEEFQTSTQEESSDPTITTAKEAWRPFIGGIDWSPITEKSALCLLVRGPHIKSIDSELLDEAWTLWAERVSLSAISNGRF